MTTLAIRPEADHIPADLAVLGEERRQRVSDALGAAHSPGTRRVYASHWNSWERWAADLGVASLPAAPVHMTAYITNRAAEGRKPATLRIGLAAISYAHRNAGLDSPTSD